MPIFATAGATLHVGGVMEMKDEDSVVGDFSLVSWTQIKKLESLGSIGDAASEIDVTHLGSRRTQRIKGLRTAQAMEIVADIDYSDAGQIALIEAEKTDFDYAFKVTFDDAPTDGTPSERYFVAAVGSVVESYDTANSLMKLSSSLWVNSNIVRVAAAPAGP